MGGHLYWYVVDYQNNLTNALQDLRERESWLRGARIDSAGQTAMLPS